MLNLDILNPLSVLYYLCKMCTFLYYNLTKCEYLLLAPGCPIHQLHVAGWALGLGLAALSSALISDGEAASISGPGCGGAPDNGDSLCHLSPSVMVLMLPGPRPGPSSPDSVIIHSTVCMEQSRHTQQRCHNRSSLPDYR